MQLGAAVLNHNGLVHQQLPCQPAPATYAQAPSCCIHSMLTSDDTVVANIAMPLLLLCLQLQAHPRVQVRLQWLQPLMN